MTNYTKEIAGLNSTIDGIKNTVKEIEEQLNTVTADYNELKEENTNLRKRVYEVEYIGQKVVRQEEEAKRRNILIDRIKEAPFQKTKEMLTELLHDLGIDMSTVTVVNIHRLGKQTTDTSRSPSSQRNLSFQLN